MRINVYIFQKNIKKTYLFERIIKMKSDALKLFRTAIGAVDPYACVKGHLVCNNKNDHVNDDDDEKKELQVGDNHITLDHNLYVAAFGKAALGTQKCQFVFKQILIKIFLSLIRHVSSCG
jgi:hypothetical protein